MDGFGVESRILDLLEWLEWLARRDRSYEEVMDAWRTSCPGLPVGRLPLHCRPRARLKIVSGAPDFATTYRTDPRLFDALQRKAQCFSGRFSS
jgi:hypothetical protein